MPFGATADGMTAKAPQQTIVMFGPTVRSRGVFQPVSYACEPAWGQGADRRATQFVSSQTEGAPCGACSHSVVKER